MSTFYTFNKEYLSQDTMWFMEIVVDMDFPRKTIFNTYNFYSHINNFLFQKISFQNDIQLQDSKRLKVNCVSLIVTKLPNVY